MTLLCLCTQTYIEDEIRKYIAGTAYTTLKPIKRKTFPFHFGVK